MSYIYRHTDCDECAGSGRRCSDYYDRGSDCFDCSGSGEQSERCIECNKADALSDDLVCEKCTDRALLDIDAFNSKWTEVHGDPFFKQRRAA